MGSLLSVICAWGTSGPVMNRVLGVISKLPAVSDKGAVSLGNVVYLIAADAVAVHGKVVDNMGRDKIDRMEPALANVKLYINIAEKIHGCSSVNLEYATFCLI